jgi:hypothetical protein
MHNYNIEIKRTFLSFAQALFAQHPKYTWERDVKSTKILIVDKNVINLKVLETKRSIVLSRGTYGWRYLGLGQRGTREGYTVGDMQMGSYPYTDMLAGSVVFNCIAQNGMVAEDIAHILFSNMTGAKEQFRLNGIHSLRNVNIGEETILKSDSSIELVTVPVYVNFETSRSLSSGVDMFENFYLELEDGRYLYQGTDYKITSTGIQFYSPPVYDGVVLARYIDAVTLEEVSEVLVGEFDGVNTSFTINGNPYTAYPLLSGIQTTLSGMY